MTNGRSAVKLIDSASCASPGLVGLKRPRALNILGRRRQDVKRVCACLGRNNDRRCLYLTKCRRLRLDVLFDEFRLSVCLTGPALKGLFAGVRVPFFGILWIGLFTFLGRQMSGVSLPTFNGLLIRKLVRTCPATVGLVGDSGQFASKERFVSSERVRVTVGHRYRYAKGQNYHRRRCVKELRVLYPRPYPLNRARAVLLIGRGRARQDGVRHVFGSNVNACRCVCISHRRASGSDFTPLTLGEANRRFRACLRSVRRLASNFVILIYRGLNEYRRTYLGAVVRHRRRARRYSGHLSASRVPLRRTIRLLS